MGTNGLHQNFRSHRSQAFHVFPDAGQGGNTAKLDWQVHGGSPTGIVVERRIDETDSAKETWSRIAKLPPTATEYSDSSLKKGERFAYPGANSFSRATAEGNLLDLHPTVKPVALVADAIMDCSSRGDIVLDPSHCRVRAPALCEAWHLLHDRPEDAPPEGGAFSHLREYRRAACGANSQKRRGKSEDLKGHPS
jgi:hypothetical protein